MILNIIPGRNVNQKLGVNFMAKNEHCLYFTIMHQSEMNYGIDTS